MNRRAVLELSGLAAGVLTSGAVQTAAPPARQAAVPPKRFLGSRVTTRQISRTVLAQHSHCCM